MISVQNTLNLSKNQKKKKWQARFLLIYDQRKVTKNEIIYGGLMVLCKDQYFHHSSLHKLYKSYIFSDFV